MAPDSVGGFRLSSWLPLHSPDTHNPQVSEKGWVFPAEGQKLRNP
mgnify:FL=1